MGKQMTFWNDKRAFRTLDGRYDSFVIMSVYVVWRLLISANDRRSSLATLWEGIYGN